MRRYAVNGDDGDDGNCDDSGGSGREIGSINSF
jgi:hypothetical protein